MCRENRLDKEKNKDKMQSCRKENRTRREKKEPVVYVR